MLPHDKLLELLNADNPGKYIFDRSNISFSNPVADAGANWNTKITLSAVPGAGFLGSVDVFYHRIDLAELGTNIWLFSEVPFTEDLILSLLNKTHNAFMLVSDVEAITVPNMVVGDIVSVVFTAKPDSVNWIGSNSAYCIIGFPGISDKLFNHVNVTLPSAGYLA